MVHIFDPLDRPLNYYKGFRLPNFLVSKFIPSNSSSSFVHRAVKMRKGKKDFDIKRAHWLVQRPPKRVERTGRERFMRLAGI